MHFEVFIVCDDVDQMARVLVALEKEFENDDEVTVQSVSRQVYTFDEADDDEHAAPAADQRCDECGGPLDDSGHCNHCENEPFREDDD